MYRLLSALIFILLSLAVAEAQDIRVNPTGVNVDSQGATTAFLTYSPVKNYRPVEDCWCGELVSAAPDRGLKCDPATLFGCLPARYDRSTASGESALTDIMSIPPSVSRRAYQHAQTGVDSRFFYVRRFVSATGGPDQYVAVTCRLTGGGARAPFSLTDVKLLFGVETTVAFIKPGERMPDVKAEISYTGTGRLKGRWEIVLPGEEMPGERDLLTEATLPMEERASQRRYTQLSRFNVFLPPAGRYSLAGPDVSRLPNAIEGSYLILLRIEASNDREADSDLAAIGAGPGVVHSGAVAGFPLPVLRYYVGGAPTLSATGKIVLLSPHENDLWTADKPKAFSWSEVEGANLYQFELTGADQVMILSALLQAGTTSYRPPSWLRDQVKVGSLRWRVVALDENGKPISPSPWRSLRFVPKQLGPKQ